MFKNLYSYLTILLLLHSAYLTGQETIQFDESMVLLKKAEELYAHNELGLCLQLIDRINKLPLHQSSSTLAKAEILGARAALQMNIENADLALQETLIKYHPSQETADGYFDLGQYYFANKQYDKSIEHFSRVTDPQFQEEVNYKLGYAHFVKKDFAKAKRYFGPSLMNKGPYFYNINYYDGMCSYFEKDYSAAIKSFRRVEKSPQYQQYVPYYITQIHFAKDELDQLISYAEPKSTNDKLKNINRIRLLIGQAYYKKGNFQKALEHLEYYESTTDKLTKEEFYQLAYTQYQNKQWQKAAENFKELNQLDTDLGQLSNYYLADCYLNLDDKVSARSAFKKVARSNFNSSIQEEAHFNFGKLSAQEGYDTDAINTLSFFKEGSKFYNESQSILSQLFLRTNDYDRSIAALENISNKSLELKSAYQVVTLSSALQSYQEGDLDLALSQIKKSLKSPISPDFKAQSLFWESLISQEKGDLSKSKKGFDLYFDNKPNKNALPPDCQPSKANYYQAYNFLKKDDYERALAFFEKSIKADLKEPHLTDATIRSGDCLFGLNRYSKARYYYQTAQSKDPITAAYAHYQNAIIEGLEGKTYEKIIVLDELLKKYPESEYVDDAYLELGDSYTLLGNNAEAFEAYEQLILNFQDRSVLINQALLKLGLSSYNQGDLKSAIKYYKKVMANNPTGKESTEALASIEEIYINNLGQSKEYLDYLDNLPNYEIKEGSRDSLNYRIAEIQFENGEYIKATRSFTDYITTHPKGIYIIPAYFNRAESETFSKNYQKALPDYEVVIDKGVSSYYETSLQKASVISLNELQDYTKAYIYSTALINFSSDPQLKHQAELNAMQSAYKSDRLEEANTLASVLLQNTLSNVEDKVAASFVIGKHSAATQKTTQAVEAFNYVIRNNSGSLAAESSYLLSELFYTTNQLEQAEQQCKSTNSVSSNYPYWIAKSLLLLSDIYLAKNDLFNARAATEAVIENFNEDPEIIKEAELKLAQIKTQEDSSNRILEEETNGLLKLDNGN